MCGIQRRGLAFVQLLKPLDSVLALTSASVSANCVQPLAIRWHGREEVAVGGRWKEAERREVTGEGSREGDTWGAVHTKRLKKLIKDFRVAVAGWRSRPLGP